MFEDSPRSTKRRKIEGEEYSPGYSNRTATGQQNKRAVPRTYGKRSRNARTSASVQPELDEPEAEAQEELDNGQLLRDRDADSTVAGTGFVDSAYHSQTNGEGEFDADGTEMSRTEPHLLDTPLGTRVPAGAVSNGAQAVLRDLDDLEESLIDGNKETTAEGEAAERAGGGLRETRSSGRQRKSTWKLTGPEPENKTPTRQKRTPTPRKRARLPEASTLSPVVKEPLLEEPVSSPAAVAAAALNAVQQAANTATPTPKKRGRPRKTAQPPELPIAGDPFNEVDELGTPIAGTPTPKKRGRQPSSKAIAPVPQITLESVPDTADVGGADQPGTLQDDLIIDSSPFKTTPLNLTPTPRKRGRPPKAKVVDEYGFTVVDPLASSEKRQRTSLAQTTEDIDPLAAFTRRDPATIAASRGKKKDVTPAKVKAVSWQEFETTEPGGHLKPDVSEALAKLQQLLQDPTYHAPLKELRTGILRSLTGKRRMPLQGLDEEYQKVRQLVEQTVVAGEGNSMFVIGPRGSGKSALMESVVSEMVTEHPDAFHVIRLNGFVHTDDKLALREIWRQLGREMELEDSMLERSNYADTLTSLLAVLSHPAEQEERKDEDMTVENQAAKSVVFIIDEFDLFTSHARQTLLYNLFDIAQARKAPIAVLGLTTRVDVAESLEKRVKSRFSHRSVFLPRPKSFPAFQQIILAALTSSNDAAIPLIDATPSEEAESAAYRTIHAAWSAYITSLFHSSTALTATLRTIYSTSRSIPTALTTFLLAISAFTPINIPEDSVFASQASILAPPDSKLSLLASLTDLELALLICAARLDIILNVDTCNFNMAFDEYTTLADRARVQSSASGLMARGGGAGGGRIWSSEAALGAWERLEILELVMPLATAGYGAGAGLADVGRAGKLMRCDVSMEEIRYSGVKMSNIMLKWCKEI